MRTALPSQQPNLQLPWIDSPLFAELLSRCNFDVETKKLIEHYADYGYVIIDLNIPNFEQLRGEIIQGLANEYRGNSRIQDAWFFNKAVRTLATNPQILSLLKVLYGREPVPFQTLNFPVGTQQKTHSDTIHFNCIPARFMCGVWVALEDIDIYNGPLHYYPGSHKLPIFDFQDLGLSPGYKNYPLYEEFIESLILAKELKQVELSVKTGQAIIWSANLLHGGSPILDTSRTRHSQVTHYFFENCLYYKPMMSSSLRKRLFEVVDISTLKIAPHVLDGKKVGYRDIRALRTLLSKKLRSHPLLAAQLNRLYSFKERLKIRNS